MATYTTYTDGSPTAAPDPGSARSFPGHDVLVGTFNAANRNLAAADVVELINIPAMTLVTNVAYETVTGDATQTLNVGDGADPDGYVAAADVGTTGNSGLGAGALAGGKLYTAADTIDIEVPATKAFDTLVVKVTVSVVYLG